MFVIYYRDSDGVSTGYSECTESLDVVAAAKDWAKDTSAIKVDTLPSLPTGKKYKVQSGVVSTIDNPDYKPKKGDRDSGLAKIELVCGMTKKEMNAVFGG